MNIEKPTLVIHKARALKNIGRMADKIKHSEGNIIFRPHFKTHQSAEVGEWYRQFGVKSITVSSVDMALYFRKHGWKDMTIAVIANPLQIAAINALSGKIDVGLLVDCPNLVRSLCEGLTNPVNIWMKIDTGYHRTGIEWDDFDRILSTAEEICKGTRFRFKGILTHAGHSYDARNLAQAKWIYNDTAEKMNHVRSFLEEKGFSGLEISVGDTPTCSAVEKFYGVDEIRCGNFVFYDVKQWHIGSCTEEDIAAAVACPVMAAYPKRREVVVYGGAVHLSKESMSDENGNSIHGRVAFPEKNLCGWGKMLEGTWVDSLSQEHGIIKTTSRIAERVKAGDVLMILPVHSCLTVDLLKDFSMEIF